MEQSEVELLLSCVEQLHKNIEAVAFAVANVSQQVADLKARVSQLEDHIIPPPTDDGGGSPG